MPKNDVLIYTYYECPDCHSKIYTDMRIDEDFYCNNHKNSVKRVKHICSEVINKNINNQM